MTQTRPPYVLAVDGGGTRCRIALARGKDITRVETGSANVSSDFGQAIAEICCGLEQLALCSDLTLADLYDTPAYLGLAGMISPAIAKELRAALPLNHMRIEDDRPAALKGALGDQDGAIAHCGTGSFLGCQINGTRQLIGGWGPRLGDAASAQWLGRQALSYTLDVVDGLLPASPLSAVILKDLDSAAGIVAFAGTATPSAFGRFAQDVTRQAHSGDPSAQALLQRGADYVSQSLNKLGWTPGMRLCLTGGVAANYAPYLPQALQQALTEPAGDPLSGALALAEEFAMQTFAGGKDD